MLKLLYALWSYAQLTRIVSTVLRQAKRNGLLSDGGEIGGKAIESRGSMTEKKGGRYRRGPSMVVVE